MDESQESPKKILAAKFFDKVAEIDQIANTALANSIDLKSELSQVQIDLKSLIESLQVNFDSGMQNVQTQINEVTNVVIEEQEIRKSETEALEQQIFAQEDQLQKDVKGKKAKTISAGSFSGNMRQKLRDTVKANPTAFGFLAGGMALTSLAGVFPQSADATDDKTGDKTDDKTGDGTGLIEENVGENAFGFGNPFNTDLGIGDDAFGFGSFNTDLGIGDDAFSFGINTYKNDDEEITKGINTYKKEDDEKITDKVEGKNQWWDFLDLFPNKKNDVSTEEFSETSTNYKKMGYNPLPIEGGSTYGDPDYNPNIATDVNSARKLVKDAKITNVKYMAGGLGGFIPGDGKGGSTYGNPDYDPYRLIKSPNTTDNNSNNEFVDGGTTVIEGGTEVVDGGTQYANNQRGEVRASTSLVKPTNSPVLAVKLSENNSIREFVVG